MSKLLLLIPIIMGIFSGLFLVVYNNENKESTNILTASSLVENGSPVLGKPTAKITILEWGDYQCTFCYRFHETTLNSLKERFIDAGKVKLVFKDFPLNGPDSVMAAEASHCANDQGKYWEYHDELYKNWGGERTGWITKYTLNAFAATVGLDLEEFNLCLEEHRHLKRVNEIHEFGKEIGIDATPSFLVFNNDKVIKIIGNQPLEVFLKAIEHL